MPLSHFGDDPGTLWLDPSGEPIDLVQFQKQWGWKRCVRRLLKKRAIVWFVDDESANREWFKTHHCRHFGILTFSSRDHFSTALRNGTPCDAVVTDIFFPAREPETDQEANDLLAIYEQISKSRVDELPELWKRVQDDWSLDGFDVARDTTAIAKTRKERIPVLLFSRKATLLLNRDEWLDESAAVSNTFWLLEKLDPTVRGDSARRVASIQRDRIVAVLRYRQAVAPWWLKLLGRVGLGWGPISVSLGRQE